MYAKTSKTVHSRTFMFAKKLNASICENSCTRKKKKRLSAKVYVRELYNFRGFSLAIFDKFRGFSHPRKFLRLNYTSHS